MLKVISPDVDLTLFITFITICKTSSIKIWFVLAAGLAENLTQVRGGLPPTLCDSTC